MEPHTFITGLSGLSQLPGLALIICVFALLWYSTFYSQKKANSENGKNLKEAYQQVLDQYENNLNNMVSEQLRVSQEMRRMYDSNMIFVEKVIALTERYDKRGDSLERLIQTNIQCWQTTLQAINDNQFCPRVKELGGKG